MVTYYGYRYRKDKTDSFDSTVWCRMERMSKEALETKLAKILRLPDRTPDQYQVIKITEEIVPFSYGVKIGESN